MKLLPTYEYTWHNTSTRQTILRPKFEYKNRVFILMQKELRSHNIITELNKDNMWRIHEQTTGTFES